MKVHPATVAELVHIHGPLKGNIQKFADDRISIGRSPSCSIRFPPELTSISRNHAEIVREGNRYKLVDHSTNGTFLNGRKVTESFLKDGDVIEFSEGGPKLSFLSPREEQTTEPLYTPQIPASPPVEEKIRPAVRVQEPPPSPLAPAPEIRPAVEAVPTESRTSSEIPTPMAAEKVSAPVIIQFGPSIKSFKDLPIVIGSGPGCDFVIPNPGVQQQHIQIFFSGGEYCIRNLTGQGGVRINANPVELQTSVHPNDLIMLSASGPFLSFLGEGRFAEASPPPDLPASQPDAEIDDGSVKKRDADDSEGLWARLRRRF